MNGNYFNVKVIEGAKESPRILLLILKEAGEAEEEQLFGTWCQIMILIVALKLIQLIVFEEQLPELFGSPENQEFPYMQRLHETQAR